MTNRYEKKRVEEIDRNALAEPTLAADERRMFMEGITLFNERKFWAAHESWEKIWHGRPEESRVFFQGIIQAAAGFHLAVERPRWKGALQNFEKSLAKLELFRGTFLGIDVAELSGAVRRAIATLKSRDEKEGAFPADDIPILDIGEGINKPGEYRARPRPRGLEWR